MRKIPKPKLNRSDPDIIRSEKIIPAKIPSHKILINEGLGKTNFIKYQTMKEPTINDGVSMLYIGASFIITGRDTSQTRKKRDKAGFLRFKLKKMSYQRKPISGINKAISICHNFKASKKFPANKGVNN